MNEIAKTDKSIDKMVDDRTVALGKEKDHAIFDSRMGWYFVPDSFKVFVMVDLAEAGRRVYHDSVRKAEEYENEAAAVKALYTRQSMEKERYRGLYGVNYYQMSNYDLVIDSTKATPKEIAEEIIRRFRAFEQGDKSHAMLLSPYRIYPSEQAYEQVEKASTKTDEQAVETLPKQNDEQMKEESTKPVEVTVKDGKWYAVSGMDRLIAAQRRGEPFVSAVVCDREINCTRELCAKVEKEGGFQYRVYPEQAEEYSNENLIDN